MSSAKLFTKRQKTEKRPRQDQTPTSTNKTPNNYVPLFILLHATGDTPLRKISPFYSEKCLSHILTTKSVRKLPSGDLPVQSENIKGAEALLKTTTLGTVQIEASPHKWLNNSRGVIGSRDLEGISDAELLNGLKAQGVTAVRRITMKKNGNLVSTNIFVLTFNRPKQPDSVKVGYLNCKVSVYVPNPLRCYKCQRYGHSTPSCRGRPTCPKCGGDGHETDKSCTGNAKCVNCQGTHPTYSKDCPRWKQEKEIQHIRAHENVSYVEAKNRVSPFLGNAAMLTPPRHQMS